MDRKKDGTNGIFPELGTFLRSTYFTVGIVDLAVFFTSSFATKSRRNQGNRTAEAAGLTPQGLSTECALTIVRELFSHSYCRVYYTKGVRFSLNFSGTDSRIYIWREPGGLSFCLRALPYCGCFCGLVQQVLLLLLPECSLHGTTLLEVWWWVSLEVRSCLFHTQGGLASLAGVGCGGGGRVQSWEVGRPTCGCLRRGGRSPRPATHQPRGRKTHCLFHIQSQ